MPIGIIINCSSVAIGGLIGSFSKRLFPDRVCQYLAKLFGITSMTIGISLIQKTDTLSPVFLAIILGAIIGEALQLEELLRKIPYMIGKATTKTSTASFDEAYVERFTGVIVLICSGSLGLMGAMTEGMTGDPSILITKSILDLFGAAIFAATLGVGISFISLLQFIIYIILYGCASLLMPLVTPAMTVDFLCCGGIIAFVTGIRVAEIKQIRIASLLPALLLVMPISALWHSLL